MKKFFLFRRSDPVGPVKRFSENGKDISILGIPADSIAFVTAGKGQVNLTFNNAGIYDANELFVGDSIEKTNVSIACEDGAELDLIKSIMRYVSFESKRAIMVFDVLNEESTFNNAIVNNVTDLEAKIKSQPTERVTQKISGGDVGARFQNIIGEINFGSRDNKPFVDYNHQSMYPVDNTDIVATAAAHWKNAGTGGAAFNITTGVGSDEVTTQTEATAAAVGLGQVCAQFGVNSRLTVPDVTIKDDYTMYFVIGDPGAGSSGNGFGVLFGDNAGETTGFSSLGSPDVFTMRHNGLDGDPFKSKTSTRTSGTESYQFPDRSSKTAVGERQFCYVFIIRRDKEFNLYLYNHEGELVSFVPALTVTSTTKTIEKKEEIKSNKNIYNKDLKSKPLQKTELKLIPKVTTGTPGRTDGNLFIQQLGTSGSNVTESFSLTLGRFGVIKRDVGDAVCSQLAQDLYDLYKPVT
tara:strand:+ start:1563 stop:2957 length:1395 start_codon:yes stop_codon:yes gene_type:complete